VSQVWRPAAKSAWSVPNGTSRRDVGPECEGGSQDRCGGPLFERVATLNPISIFERDEDFAAFERILAEGRERYDMRILAYCLLSNHWHWVLWPKRDGDLSRFVGWVTLTHTQLWHAYRGSTSSGHVYQGRFKSFPIQDDDHLFVVCRYVERNALRAMLVEQAEQWQWSSLWRWRFGNAKQLLSNWPVARPRG
jgi:putative transposase